MSVAGFASIYYTFIVESHYDDVQVDGLTLCGGVGTTTQLRHKHARRGILRRTGRVVKLLHRHQHAWRVPFHSRYRHCPVYHQRRIKHRQVVRVPVQHFVVVHCCRYTIGVTVVQGASSFPTTTTYLHGKASCHPCCRAVPLAPMARPPHNSPPACVRDIPA